MVGQDYAGGKDHIGREDHAGGERSGCWERIMMVLEDDYFCKMMISVQKKYVFCTERTPVCPFATKIAAKYMSSRARPDPTHHFPHKNSHVEIDPKFYVFFLQGVP